MPAKPEPMMTSRMGISFTQGEGVLPASGLKGPWVRSEIALRAVNWRKKMRATGGFFRDCRSALLGRLLSAKLQKASLDPEG
jgi:hypothetical protein